MFEIYDSVVNTVFRLLERQFGVDLLSWFLSQAAQSAPKWFNDKEYSPGIPLKVAKKVRRQKIFTSLVPGEHGVDKGSSSWRLQPRWRSSRWRLRRRW